MFLLLFSYKQSQCNEEKNIKRKLTQFFKGTAASNPAELEI